MPRLSDSMEEGTIIKWLKGAGDEVRVGDPLADIETDKATVTYEADDGGFLQPLAAEGDTLQIGSTIARLLESADAAKAAPAPSAPAAPPPAAACRGRAAGRRAVGSRRARYETPPAAAPSPASAPGARVKASPVARRIATEIGLDLASVAGSGPEGRIVKADVLAASTSAPAPPAAASRGGDASGAKGEVTVVELTRTQALIARRMASAKATIPRVPGNRRG